MEAERHVVTQVRAAEAVETSLIPSVQGLLNGRASSVVVMPGTGMVGTGAKIRIRGASSLSLSNDPLIYVDGVRVDNSPDAGPEIADGRQASVLNDFNPDDIESIEIIKGPAAASLYGTEASAGVIQIITRQGREGTPVWNLTVRQGGNWFRNAEERVPTNYWRPVDEDGNPGEIQSINFAQTERERGTPLWRTGHLQNYNLSLSGGTSGVRYHLSGHMDREEGADRDNDLRRAGLRANLTVSPMETLEIGGTVGYTTGRFNLACEAGCGGVTWASYFSTPAHAQGDDRRRGARSFTPEYYWEFADRFQEMGRFTGSFQLTHTPTERFRHQLTFGIDDTREDDRRW